MLHRHLPISEPTQPAFLRSKVYVTPDARVVDDAGHPVATELSEDGEPVIELDWFDGQKKYPLALLVLHVFKPIHIPLKYWTYLKALYVDGRKDNTHFENLYWWLPAKTIEYETMPGFFYVPGATRYVVNRKGDVFDTVLQKYQRHYQLNSEDGYLYVSVSLKHDDNKHRLVRVHRLVVMTQHGYDIEKLAMHVNHKDGVADNNDADNLEWSTPQENHEHALESGLSPLRWTYKITNSRSGEVVTNLNLNHLRERSILTSASLAIEMFKDDCEVEVGDWTVEKVKPLPRPVQERNNYEVKDLTSGEVVLLKTKTEIGRLFNVGSVAAGNIVKRGPTQLLPGKRLLRTVGKESWPATTNDLPLFEFGKRSVLIRHLTTGEIREFDQVIDAADHLGIHKDGMIYRLDKNDQRVWPDYTQCQYKEEFTPWRIAEDPQLEIDKNAWKKAVDVRDVRTGQIKRYDSRRQAALACGVVEAVVSVFLMKDEIATTKSGHQFKLTIDPRPWPVIEDPFWEIAQANTQRPVTVVNPVSGEQKLFISSKECASFFGYPTSSMSYWLNGKTPLLPNGWQVSFYKKRSSASM